MQLSERIYHHWITARHIAHLLEDPVEMIEQEAKEDGWLCKTVEHHIDYDGQGIIDAVLYDVRSIRMGTRIMVAVYLLMDIEERLEPLLFRADSHAKYIGQWFPTVSKQTLRAAVYRSQQFVYARDIQLAFQVHEKDALMIFAEVFCLEREFLYNMALTITGKEEDIFGLLIFHEAHLSSLIHYFSIDSGPMMPEFERPSNLQMEALQ